MDKSLVEVKLYITYRYLYLSIYIYRYLYIYIYIYISIYIYIYILSIQGSKFNRAPAPRDPHGSTKLRPCWMASIPVSSWQHLGSHQSILEECKFTATIDDNRHPCSLASAHSAGNSTEETFLDASAHSGFLHLCHRKNWNLVFHSLLIHRKITTLLLRFACLTLISPPKAVESKRLSKAKPRRCRRNNCSTEFLAILCDSIADFTSTAHSHTHTHFPTIAVASAVASCQVSQHVPSVPGCWRTEMHQLSSPGHIEQPMTDCIDEFSTAFPIGPSPV